MSTKKSAGISFSWKWRTAVENATTLLVIHARTVFYRDYTHIWNPARVLVHYFCINLWWAHYTSHSFVLTYDGHIMNLHIRLEKNLGRHFIASSQEQSNWIRDFQCSNASYTVIPTLRYVLAVINCIAMVQHLVLVGNKGRPTAVLQAIHLHLGNQECQPLQMCQPLQTQVKYGTLRTMGVQNGRSTISTLINCYILVIGGLRSIDKWNDWVENDQE